MACCAKNKDKDMKDLNEEADAQRQREERALKAAQDEEARQRAAESQAERLRQKQLEEEERARDAERAAIEREERERELKIQEEKNRKAAEDAAAAAAAATRATEEERRRLEAERAAAEREERMRDSRDAEDAERRRRQREQEMADDEAERQRLLSYEVQQAKDADALREAREQERRKKAIGMIAAILCCLLLLACIFGSYFTSTAEKKDPAFSNATALNPLSTATGVKSDVITSASQGVIAVSTEPNQPDAGFYREDESSLHDGRYTYLGPNGVKIAYVDNESKWTLASSSGVICENFFNSSIPPTNGWECADQEYVKRQFDLLDSVYLTGSDPKAGESMIYGEFTETGNRSGRAFYQNEEGCQMTFNQVLQGWEILCYSDWCSQWQVLYFARNASKRPPTEGWSNSDGNAKGAAPVPTFQLLDLKGNWQGGNAGEPTQRATTTAPAKPIVADVAAVEQKYFVPTSQII